MSGCEAKGTSWHVHPSKTQTSLGKVWSESLMGSLLVAKGPAYLQVENEDSDQTKLICRLI